MVVVLVEVMVTGWHYEFYPYLNTFYYARNMIKHVWLQGVIGRTIIIMLGIIIMAQVDNDGRLNMFRHDCD